ncbi:MAG: heme-binding protein [Candidatus Nitronauta litoralis]|uniref:Heme-binding protein n=1 Tax=Candidatus Nitronauta litoralis TaxID=2705533 RepID=A0A7T0BXE5_9BACT|nr:MAG: heme-binding protein [Candidatus Nitronauta litoralis]
MAELTTVKDLSDDLARHVLRTATGKARELDCKMNVAVVGSDGNLKSFFRMEGAWTGSIDIAIKKAKTARLFNMSTGEVGKLSQPGGSFYQIEHSNGGLVTFPGGIPLKTAQGDIVGAIGASGDTVENEHKVALAGVEYLLKALKGE